MLLTVNNNKNNIDVIIFSQMPSKYSHFKPLCVVLLSLAMMSTLTSCGDTSPVEGQWALMNYCYGSDCIQLASHDIDQMWEFSDDLSSLMPEQCSAPCRMGFLFQDDVINDTVFWSLNTTGDSLCLYATDGHLLDVYYVSMSGNDTLILSSMINNILVQKQFVRI